MRTRKDCAAYLYKLQMEFEILFERSEKLRKINEDIGKGAHVKWRAKK